MQEAQNTKIVKDAYEASGRGDVQARLGAVYHSAS